MRQSKLSQAIWLFLAIIATVSLSAVALLPIRAAASQPPEPATGQAQTEPHFPKVVTGKVETNTGVPVQAAKIIAVRLDQLGFDQTLTNPAGEYEIILTPGLWFLTVLHTDQTDPPHWVYTHGPQLVHFDHDLEPELKRVNFEVITADATVSGVVQMPDASPPPFSVTVALRNNEGLGRSVEIEADGSFSVRVPNGNYVLYVIPRHPDYAGPRPLPLHVPENGDVDVGVLTLLARDALVTGTVKSETDAPVEGVYVAAWTRFHQGASDITGPDGDYALRLVPGDYLVRPFVPASLPYIYTGGPITLTVESSQVISDVDFILTDAPNTVIGQLATPDGEPVSAAGWVTAKEEMRPVNGSPIREGTFTLYLPDGDFELGARLLPGSEWMAGHAQPVTVAGGETISVTIPVLPRDATLAGALWDPRNEVVVTGVAGMVVAHNPFASAATPINPDNGLYRLNLSAGLWCIGYWLRPDAGYVPLDHHIVAPLQSGLTFPLALPVAERDSIISGLVLDPDGAPLAGAAVVAHGIGPELGQVTLRAISGDDGSFRLPVPHGVYNVWASHARPDWLNPAQATVIARPDAAAELQLQFQEPDIVVSGITQIAGRDNISGTVHIWAYSNAGAGAYSSARLGEPYELNLLSNSDWTIGAVYETSSSYYGTRIQIELGEEDVELDLTLQGPFPKPGPVSITFDAADTQEIVLSDGTRILIPAGAMPAEGIVTLHATPIATLPHHHHARLYPYGYAFVALDSDGNPITGQFNQTVTISFTYDDAHLTQAGLVEHRLKPAYYSTSTQSWTIPTSYVVDRENNRIVMEIDHFTDFSLLNTAESANTFLPLMTH
jgi:hypothetical protein